ncbi:hypothetical protein O181_069706 [Austropuccinia psidii MF-1]|uniref:Uncharacterized protein n=1 Tax=Austropuccinia psidii MF-1 TaxID=1389203 RepID=A0A9Q3I512_9BASI|nr:hypothetical protein [Austropuccinia psidii MF-1]
MRYKDYEGYTHEWVMILPEVQLPYHSSQHSTPRRSPSLVEKGWNPLFPVDHLKRSLLTLHPTTKDFHDMWPFPIIKLIRQNSLEEKLTEEFSTKHPVFPVSLVKPYFQTDEYKFPSRKKYSTAQKRVEVEESPGPVKTTIRARKIRFNAKDQSQYLVRFQNQTAGKYKWLAEDAITYGNLHLRRFTASKRTEQSHQ